MESWREDKRRLKPETKKIQFFLKNMKGMKRMHKG
jgi:hypothetical protein